MSLKGPKEEETVNRMKLIMEELDLKQEDRKAVSPAREYAGKLKSVENEVPAIIALELPDGKIVTGKESDLMDNCSAGILNAIKYLAGIADEIYLLSPVILNTIQNYKSQILNKITTLSLNEINSPKHICSN